MDSCYLLDTNIIVFLLRMQYDIDDKIQIIGIDHCFISEITYAELLYGAECSSNPQHNVALVDNVLKGIRMVQVSNSLQTFAKCKATLRRMGKMVDDIDLLIGATAIANKMVMVTDNTKHFENMPNITLENWIIRV